MKIANTLKFSLLTLVLSACEFVLPSLPSEDGSSNSSLESTSLVSSTTEVTTSSTSTSTTPTSTGTSQGSTSSSTSTTSNNVPLNPKDLTLGQDIGDFWSIPATGNPKVLVVPVEFNDRVYANPTTVTNQINQTFNGASTSSFESLNSFYLTSSFGKLDLDGVVTTPFRTQFNASYYENLINADPNSVIINEIMNALNSTYDFSEFDANNDGNLDGIYMIYNYPPGDWGSFWWAYLSSYTGNTRYDGVIPTSYIWMPYSFVVVNNTIDATTFIHETGHMLGLEDYYDYYSSSDGDTSGNEYGLGGADMMDANTGDHNPFSKLLLGWIEPLVVTQAMSLNLSPYISSGQAYIITDDWNGTLFDEYIIAMYYTPTGFYQGFDDFFFDGRSGLVLYHVDARYGPNYNSQYPTFYLNNNTDSTHKLIKFIEADGNNSLYNGNPVGWMWASDVYRPGDVFRGNKNPNYTWNQTSRGLVGFTITVGNELSNYQGMSLQVNFN